MNIFTGAMQQAENATLGELLMMGQGMGMDATGNEYSGGGFESGYGCEAMSDGTHYCGTVWINPDGSRSILQ